MKKNYALIILERESEAQQVLANMKKTISSYGNVTIVDLYDQLGIVGCYKDVGLGWTDLSTATVCSAGDGYSLELPNAIELS